MVAKCVSAYFLLAAVIAGPLQPVAIPTKAFKLTVGGVQFLAWASNSEVLYWGQYPNSAAFKVLDVNTGTSRDAALWNKSIGQRPHSVSFADDVGAWLTPAHGSPSDRLRWMSLYDGYSREVQLERNLFWTRPVWWVSPEGKRLVTVCPQVPGICVAVYDFGHELPFRVEHFRDDSIVGGVISRVRTELGCTSDGRWVALGTGGMGTKVELVNITLGGPTIDARSYMVKLPDSREFSEAVLCGSKIVWLLQVKASSAGTVSGPAAKEYELWTSSAEGDSFSRVVNIPRPPATRTNSDMRVRVFGVRARPDGKAVAYISGNQLAVVPIR